MTAELQDPGCAIGIDVGATKLAGGVVALASGQLVTRKVCPTEPGRGPHAVVADIAALAAELHAALPPGQPFRGVGLGLPELVAPEGTISSAYLLDWDAAPLEQALGPGPLRVEADVRAHARAEARYGAGRDRQQFVYVSVGSGISACLVLHGRPHQGMRGNALVFSSGQLSIPCPVCGELRPFVLEEYASGLALAARYNHEAAQPVARAEELAPRAVAGDVLARRVLSSAGTVLGSGIAWLVNVLDPEAVIIGGGLGLAGGLYWDSLTRAVRAHIWAPASRELPLLRAALGADAGIVGAALAVAEQRPAP